MTARGWTLAALVACAGLVLAQGVLIGRVELTFDEAYYMLWSRSLAWGYYDHPPMIAAWIRASTEVFGSSEAGVRALDVVAFASLPVLVARIAFVLFGAVETAALAALLLAAMPLMAGAPLATPDAPLTFFATLALWGFVEAWAGRGWGWGVVGLALGAAALSKFTALFVAAGLAIAWLARPGARARVDAPGPWLALALAAAVFAPFVWWNAQHGWATFAKQFGRVPAHGFAPGYLLEFLGAQFGLANPLVVVLAALGGLGGAGGRAGEARRLLWTVMAPAFAYFAVHALHDRVQGNWLAPFFPPLALLAADSAARGARAARLVAPAVALGLGFVALAYAHAATLWPSLGPADPLARIGGWRDLAAEVAARARAEGAGFVLARGYAATSLLTWYGGDAARVVQFGEAARWRFQPPPPESLFAQPGLAFGEAGPDFAAGLAARFDRVEPVGSLARRFAGAPVGDFTLYRVSGPKTPDPAAD